MRTQPAVRKALPNGIGPAFHPSVNCVRMKNNGAML